MYYKNYNIIILFSHLINYILYSTLKYIPCRENKKYPKQLFKFKN